MRYFPSFFILFFFYCAILCERSLTLLVLLYKIAVHINEIQKCKYLCQVSIIYHIWCFDTDFEFVFHKKKFKQMNFIFVRKLKRTIKLTRAGGLRQTYFLNLAFEEQYVWTNRSHAIFANLVLNEV